MSIGIIPIPDDRICDIRRDLRSTLGYGPRGTGIYFLYGEYSVSGKLYVTKKANFINKLNRQSFGVRVGDIVLYKQTTGVGQLCLGVVTRIDGDDVFFQEYSKMAIDGISPVITVREIRVGEDEHGYSITITDGNGQSQFTIMDGVDGKDFKYSDFTEEQLADLRSSVASAFCTKREASRTISSVPVTAMSLPAALRYESGDMLFVDVNGLSLCEGVDFTVSNNTLVLTEANRITHAGTVVNFKSLSMVTMTQHDIDDIAASVAGSVASQLPVASSTTNGMMSASDKAKLDSASVVGMMTPNNGFQRVTIGDGYADVPLVNSSTGLIDEDNIPHPCGSTRPRSPIDGMSFFDTNLHKPIWYYGGAWYAADGAVVQ